VLLTVPVTIATNAQNTLLEALQNIGSYPEAQQITVCRWVDGQYEDTVFREARRIQSDVIPALELTVDQVFALHN
jgi:Uma2 family endonuclease